MQMEAVWIVKPDIMLQVMVIAQFAQTLNVQHVLTMVHVLVANHHTNIKN